MSSHHIVRENQEPALVILNAHAIPLEKVQELLEWMPTIVVLHSQIEIVVGWGIKIDVVLVPAGEEEIWIDRTKDQYPIEIVSFSINEIPLSKAIEILAARHIPAMNVLASDENTLSTLEEFTGDVEAFFESKRWSRIKSGRFEKWIAAGTMLFVLPENVHTKIPQLVNGKLVAKQDGILTLQGEQSFWVGEWLN
jgi:hypothetical protein